MSEDAQKPGPIAPPAVIAKRAAASRALDLVADGMTLGLGSGSTAEIFVEFLAEVREERFPNLVCVSTSRRTTAHAKRLGIEITEFDDAGWVDLTIDGADEIAPDLTLIKGAGGALLREKIVASASDRLVIIADRSKAVETLGAFSLPVEITPFGWRSTKAVIEALASIYGADAAVARRRVVQAPDGSETPYYTDQGNLILDLPMGVIAEPEEFAVALNAAPGVVENGLFVGLADAAILGEPDGGVALIEIDDN